MAATSLPSIGDGLKQEEARPNVESTSLIEIKSLMVTGIPKR